MANQITVEVKLHTYNNDVTKEWYVSLYMPHPKTGIKTEKQVRLGINREKDLRSRIAAGRAVCAVVEQAIFNGWDPFCEPIKQFLKRKSKESSTPDINHKTFDEALDFGLDKGTWSKKTKICYNGTAKFYKEAAKKLGLNASPIQEITKQQIMLLTDQVKKTRKWSNKAINKNVGYLAAILKILKDWEIIPHNPAHDIAKLPEAESEKYQPYTAAEKKQIHEALYNDHFRFYVLFMLVYHTGIRPKEVLALKISDVNLLTDEIKIIPDLEEENSKTKSIRRIPINPHLKKLLLDLGLEKYPSSHYIFGSPYGRGKTNIVGYNKQHRVTHPDYFKPSANRIPRNYITLLWKELIWEGKKVHKYLYAAKHTGGDDKILAGVDLDALRELYGHSSKQMTENYVSQLREVHKKKIIENSPDFI